MCSLEFSDIETEIWQPLGGQGLTVVGLNTGGLGGGDDAARIATFIEQTGVTFPVAQDVASSYGTYAAGPGISPFPLDVVVDRTGTIVYATRKYDPAALRAVIESVL